MAGSDDLARWVDPAEWKLAHRTTETSANGAVQFRVAIYESRTGLPKLRGLVEFWIRVASPGGGVDYQPDPGAVFKFEYDAAPVVERLVRARCGGDSEGKGS